MQAEETGKPLMNQIRAGLVLLVLALVLVFGLQNTETVTVAFLFWQLTLPRALLYFIFFSAGLLIGLAVQNWHRLIRPR